MEHSFADEFVALLRRDLPSPQVDALCCALNGSSPTSVRVNPLRSMAVSPSVDLVPWSGGVGYYLDRRPSFTLDPLLHGGAYYVQEASSMIVARVAAQYAPRFVLDLCAAPGGKSTHLASVIPSDGVVVANEVIKSRASILRENCIKWGSGNIVVTNSDPRCFAALGGMFDLLVVDTPCSGEGMFRKDLSARDEWSIEGVENCFARSCRILADSWNSLKVGGILVYSTCTFNHIENESVVSWICSELSGEVVPQSWGDLGAEGVVDNGLGGHFYPSQVRGEGLFCSVIRKVSSGECTQWDSRASRKMNLPSKAEQQELDRWVRSPLNWRLVGKTIYGYNSAMSGIIEELLSNLNVIYSGVEMGEMIRGELKPSHPLALYHDLRFESRSELELSDALDYLRREAVSRSLFGGDGLTLVSYRGVALGWAKVLSTRVNNNYPAAWRIRMQGE
ncbi:MAG: rRNA cytosine-C5-methylase [Rikenellaceae bacterium]